MRLIELKLLYFKGIREFLLLINGRDANVYGDNRTGKTTLKDSFSWLLFGKNSKNQKEFNIKMHDENKKPIPAINHEVSAKLELDSDRRPVELRRVYYEKWTKKRGSTTKELTGHSTDYYIDGVPTKEKEYKEFIASIIDEKTFRLLIDPYYFSETLPWQERRSLLFNICGNISDKDVIESNPELTELVKLLNGRTIEQHKIFVKNKCRNINQELNEIPIRIDEANRAISNNNRDHANESEMVKMIESIKTDIEKKRQKRIDLQQGGGIPEKQKDLAEVESRMNQYRLNYEADLDKSLMMLNKELNAIESDMEKIDQKYSSKQKIYDANNEEIDHIEEELSSLRAQWHKVDAEEFKYEASMACPNCGYDLMQEAREKALADFNKYKAETLERIQTKGKVGKERAEKLRAENKAISKEIIDLQAERQKLDVQATGYDNRIDALRATHEDYVNNKKYVELSDKKANLAVEISKLKNGQNRDAILVIDKEIEASDKLLAEAESDLAQIKQSKAIKLRIEDLKKQERNLAKEYERFEKEMRLIEKFTTVKAEMTEENVNRKFKLARFKLFNLLINGGLEDCCEVTDVKGVPYSTDLSNSERINIGLDIIKTLETHYGISAPIFIDNAEGITDIIPTQGQQIRLYVLANQKNLKTLIA